MSHRFHPLNPRQMYDDDEVLIPIKIELECGEVQVNENFVWSSKASQKAVDAFVAALCHDLDVSHTYAQAMSETMNQQISAFLSAKTVPLNKEMRRIIRLDITIGNIRLEDQFEWDIANPFADPEAFANQLCMELELPREFSVIVSQSIREQIHLHLVAEAEYKTNVSDVPPPVHHVLRDAKEIGYWTPIKTDLTEEDLEKLEAKRSREVRVQRRSASRNYSYNGVWLGSVVPKIIRTQSQMQDELDIDSDES
eukprot:TRINITY_DN15796_c0_g1_i1.p1 TRINITY_DN15796_c0_g1~~TRINITY_DN15796_c0_g1_i1.p1  ORF type:complete len:253 (+),score=54.31 TRINITY_DN15796_c0_g1_i1:73-831(+)